MSLLPLIILGAAITGQVQKAPPDDAEKTVREYFEALYTDRERITSGHLEYTVTLDIFTRSKELTGSEYTYRFWFDKTRRRLDVDSVHPKSPERNQRARYAFDGTTYRIIDTDRSDCVVREFTTAFLAGEPPRVLPMGAPSDPRVIGTAGMEYGMSIHHQLDECLAFDPKAIFQTGLIKLGELDAVELTIHSPKNHKTLIVPRGEILPTRMTTQFGSKEPGGGPPYPIRVEVESDVSPWPNDRGKPFAFPRTIKARRFVNGAVESAETLTVHTANFNVPISASDLTWKALRPAIGVGMLYNGNYLHDDNKAVVWDGERFASVVVTPPPLDASEPSTSDPRTDEPNSPVVSGSMLRTLSFVTLGLALLLAVAVTTLKLSRRRAAHL